MYLGEVTVLQEDLQGLIKAAECLKIKGLAAPDELPEKSKDGEKDGNIVNNKRRTCESIDSCDRSKRYKTNKSDVCNGTDKKSSQDNNLVCDDSSTGNRSRSSEKECFDLASAAANVSIHSAVK